MKETIFGIIAFALIFIVVGFFLGGVVAVIEVVGVFLAETASPFLIQILWIILPFVFFILIPLSFIDALKGITGTVIFYSSFFFGLITWIFGFVATYYTWGTTAIIIGLLLGGIGVVPIGFLAALITGQWLALFMILLGVAVTWGTRLIAFRIMESEEL